LEFAQTSTATCEAQRNASLNGMKQSECLCMRATVPPPSGAHDCAVEGEEHDKHHDRRVAADAAAPIQRSSEHARRRRGDEHEHYLR
jgi:hypothetical protein